jgi:DNA-binding NarL/FixJ family response regulator
MKPSSNPCVVLSDYPIKMMAYQRFLSGLGENGVLAFKSLSPEGFVQGGEARLVVCDLNVMEEFEAQTLAQVEELFPQANILFLEEDHSDMKIRFTGQRDICRLGKLAEIHVIYSTIKELLLQSGHLPKRHASEDTRQTEQT